MKYTQIAYSWLKSQTNLFDFSEPCMSEWPAILMKYTGLRQFAFDKTTKSRSSCQNGFTTFF